MKALQRLLVLLLTLYSATGLADYPADLDQLLRQVNAVHSKDSAIRAEREARFIAEKTDRKRLLAELRSRVEAQRARGEDLKQRFETNETGLQILAAELTRKTGNLGELFGTVRQAANELHPWFRESLVSVQYPGRAEWFNLLAKSRKLPNLDALERFWLLVQQEIMASGEVARFSAEVTGTEGISQPREVIRIGLFNAIAGDKYLRFLPDSNRLVELSRQPAERYLELARQFSGAPASEDHAPIMLDPTRGALLRVLVHAPTLVERIHQGGIVGYIIIALGILGLLVVAHRLVYLGIIGRRMHRQAGDPGLPAANNPLGRVLAAVPVGAADDTEAMELQLDEAIQKESPALTRGLALVKLLAGIAPLLGLLGTVTGMILTFQSISLFGTGDPKLMAGGISQALVTTVLGLSVAIPLLFCHSLMAARSRTLIQILDEQSAALLVKRLKLG